MILDLGDVTHLDRGELVVERAGRSDFVVRESFRVVRGRRANTVLVPLARGARSGGPLLLLVAGGQTQADAERVWADLLREVVAEVSRGAANRVVVQTTGPAILRLEVDARIDVVLVPVRRVVAEEVQSENDAFQHAMLALKSQSTATAPSLSGS